MIPSADELDELTQIGRELRALPEPPALGGRDDFMEAGVRAMSLLLAIGKLSVSLPRSTGRGYTRRHAPIVGLMVRMVKLYEGYLDQMVSRRRELMTVYQRPLYEAHVKLAYLIRSGKESARSFIETSFRSEKEILEHLNSLKAKRQLVPIERRMRDSVRRHLRRVGVTQEQLLARKQWNIDGKDMRSLLKCLGRDLQYAFVFGASSHAVHGTWYDLWINHLSKDAAGFHPDITYGSPEPRHLGPPAVILGESLILFLRYFRLDRRNQVRPKIKALIDYFNLLDGVWEQRLIAQSGRAT